jgi:uncharacterized Tic20 family protein
MNNQFTTTKHVSPLIILLLLFCFLLVHRLLLTHKLDSEELYSAVQKKVVQKVLTIHFYSVLSDCLWG